MDASGRPLELFEGDLENEVAELRATGQDETVNQIFAEIEDMQRKSMAAWNTKKAAAKAERDVAHG